MPTYQDLIGDVIGYWEPEDGDQLVGTLLQVGWDTDGTLAADIQPEEDSPEGEAPSKAPLRVRIGDKFWKDWSEAGPSQGGPSRGDLVRITYQETPLMSSETAATFESDNTRTEQKTTARYQVEVLGEEEGFDEIS